MKNNIWKWILIVALALGTLFIIYESRQIFMEKPFKVVTLHKESLVINETKIPYLDTIVHLGLAELHIPKTLVMIRTLDPSQAMSDSGLEIKAYVIEEKGQYLIFIQSMDRKESLLVLSHEMIHIAQFYLGDVKVMNKGILWKKEALISMDTPYEQRPWEIEAFALQGELNKRLSKQLY